MNQDITQILQPGVSGFSCCDIILLQGLRMNQDKPQILQPGVSSFSCCDIILLQGLQRSRDELQFLLLGGIHTTGLYSRGYMLNEG